MWISTRYRFCSRVIPISLIWAVLNPINAVGSYTILEIPFHARSLSMAGAGTADPGGRDASAFNPALIGVEGENTQHLFLSLLSYPGEINTGAIEWQTTWRGIPTALSLRHVSYGDFDRLDDSGIKTGTFNAGDSWVSAAASYPLGSILAFGVSTGLLVSQVDNVSATLGLLTAGMAINVPSYNLHLGLALNNLGFIISNYTDHNELVPKSITAGVTKKLKYLPLELSIDGSWWNSEDRSVIRIGGEFSLPHDLYFRWGTSTYKLEQTTQNLWRDIATGTAFGVGLAIDKLIVDIGFNYGGVEGIVMGIGISWRF